MWYVVWPFSDRFFLLDGLAFVPNLQATTTIFGIIDLINYSCETIIGIWGIPLISLSLTDDGVNSLDILTSNFTTFIYILCYLESSLKENGYSLVILRELCILIMFYANCASCRSSSCNLFWNHCRFVFSSVVVLQSLFLTYVIPHI